MIARITGQLAYKSVNYLIVEVHGIGYQVTVPLSTYYRLPEPPETLTLHIHTYVKEDAFNLFGFLSLEEREMFESLLKVNKVGPRLALSLLSGMSLEEMKQALGEGNVARISAIPGVGVKTAERLVLELRGKLVPAAAAPPGWKGGRAELQVLHDATSALLNLGYKRPEAEKAIGQARVKWEKEAGGAELPLEGLIRQALNLLSPAKG
ncbi:MAG: Holliday junction branch migration protein RuvA [Candidatus Tectomicrobia bacterium]|uniref:Holliday junction branch migration complex subunit RuvA n=1 Tax=Tectimicrobiota bacterium TaxID=2528274 RepID=A0A932CNI4_UNCTE|nr:Holliday junction branch migration protein RuvA [Candidatus Tectomicrobia bacterium]